MQNWMNLINGKCITYYYLLIWIEPMLMTYTNVHILYYYKVHDTVDSCNEKFIDLRWVLHEKYSNGELNV